MQVTIYDNNKKNFKNQLCTKYSCSQNKLLKLQGHRFKIQKKKIRINYHQFEKNNTTH